VTPTRAPRRGSEKGGTGHSTRHRGTPAAENLAAYWPRHAVESRIRPDTPGQRRSAPVQRFRWSEALLDLLWQVKDSNFLAAIWPQLVLDGHLCR
jgi:hypothetical protein